MRRETANRRRAVYRGAETAYRGAATAEQAAGHSSRCYGVLPVGAACLAVAFVAEKLMSNQETINTFLNTISTFLSNNTPDAIKFVCNNAAILLNTPIVAGSSITYIHAIFGVLFAAEIGLLALMGISYCKEGCGKEEPAPAPVEPAPVLGGSRCYGVLSMGAACLAVAYITEKLMLNKETISTFLSNNVPDTIKHAYNNLREIDPNTPVVIGAGVISIGAAALAGILCCYKKTAHDESVNQGSRREAYVAATAAIER